MGFLGKLFGKSLEQLAVGHDRDAFIQRLGRSDIRIIAAFEGDGLDLSVLTPEQLRAELEKAVKDLSERESFEPFIYARDGRRRLPFFTSERAAQTFAGSYSKERGRLFPFQILGVKGALLGRFVSQCDVLVMNDRGQDEVELSEPDAAAMQRLWGEPNPPS